MGTRVLPKRDGWHPLSTASSPQRTSRNTMYSKSPPMNRVRIQRGLWFRLPYSGSGRHIHSNGSLLWMNRTQRSSWVTFLNRRQDDISVITLVWVTDGGEYGPRLELLCGYGLRPSPQPVTHPYNASQTGPQCAMLLQNASSSILYMVYPKSATGTGIDEQTLVVGVWKELRRFLHAQYSDVRLQCGLTSVDTLGFWILIVSPRTGIV